MIRLAITATFILTATVAAQSPDTQSVPPSFVIARGKLNAAAHEIQDGSFNLSNGSQPAATVFMPRGAVSLLRAKDLDGYDVELVIRPLTKRELETIK